MEHAHSREQLGRINRESTVNRIVFCIALALCLQACSDDGNNAAKSAPVVEKTEPAPKQTGAGVTIKEATERLFQNPYDTDAVYFLSQKNGTPEALSVLIKRVGPEGTQYSRWLFNCTNHTAQNLGVATSIQALDNSANNMPSKSQKYEANTKLGAIATSVCN